MAASALKLSPSLKALIALPAAHGAPTPCPSRATTYALFDRVRKGGEAGGVGRETWLSLGTAALFTINSPDAVCELFNYATQGQAVKDKVHAAAVS